MNWGAGERGLPRRPGRGLRPGLWHSWTSPPPLLPASSAHSRCRGRGEPPFPYLENGGIGLGHRGGGKAAPDRRALSCLLGAEPAAAARLGRGVFMGPACCGGTFVSQLPGRLGVYTGRPPRVLTVTPNILDQQARGQSRLWLPAASLRQSPASPRPPHRVTGHVSCLCHDTRWQMALVNSAAEASLDPCPAGHPTPAAQVPSPSSRCPSRPPQLEGAS